MRLLSSARKIIKKACYSVLPKQTLSLIQRREVIIYWLDMRLHPRKMKRFCPCCGMRFREFVAGDFRQRPGRFNPARYEHTKQDIICPVCRSMPRHRIQALWFARNLELIRKADILYIAPEISETKWLKRNRVTCTTADLYKDADLKLDIQNTGLSDESYDVIICNHVLEHVDDFRQALKEIYRILRTGGSFICSFPMDPKVELLDEDSSVQTEEERLKRYGQNDHKRVFGMKADRFLKEAGFTVEKIRGEEYPENILPVVGPADYDMNILFYSEKRSTGG